MKLSLQYDGNPDGWALTEEKAHGHRFLLGNTKVRYHLEDPGMDGRIIIKWILKKWDGKA